MPGMNRSTAVPALVNCRIPSRWISPQDAPVASQKSTWPMRTGSEPAATVAVSVTTVPDTTVAPEPPEDKARLVLVCEPIARVWPVAIYTATQAIRRRDTGITPQSGRIKITFDRRVQSRAAWAYAKSIAATLSERGYISCILQRLQTVGTSPEGALRS